MEQCCYEVLMVFTIREMKYALRCTRRWAFRRMSFLVAAIGNRLPVSDEEKSHTLTSFRAALRTINQIPSNVIGEVFKVRFRMGGAQMSWASGEKLMLLSLNNRLLKAQVTAVALICVSNLTVFIALLTPAWQVAKDTDAGVYVQSGLWLYCPGSAQCWYIFSDDVVNYYERVDVCRFFLIGDCRKKLLRTPYFFGWHYAVLIIIIFALIFGVAATAALGVSICKKNKARVLTIAFNGFAFLSFLLLAIALAVFVINAEMLESRYLIGIKNTFRACFRAGFDEFFLQAERSRSDTRQEGTVADRMYKGEDGCNETEKFELLKKLPYIDFFLSRG
uniref:Uncharacterized protein n=1 Tax=Parascaris univalens TaxID=6257 RepID=A0A915B9N0_PARUN